MTKNPAPITGLVLTYNGERLLDQCLESLSFCDRVLVVDSESTDKTREIAKARGAEVVVRPWPGPVDQFRFALEQIPEGWIVSLDQDERLSGELSDSIRQALARDEDLAGYWVNRRNFYYDRFMKHSGWYPDRLLRVFRAGMMEVTASGAHYSFRSKGPTRKLSGDIVHYPYSGLADQMDKLNYYAQAGADDLRAKGRKGGLVRAVAHAKVRFFKLYFLKLGFLDGRAGFINAACGAYYAFQKYIRVDEPEG